MADSFNFAKRTDWSLENNPLSTAIEQIQAKGGSFLDLTASNPTQCAFDYPHHWISHLCSAEASVYQADSKGLLCARKAVGDYYQQKNITLDFNRVLLTSSTSEGYSFLLKLLADGGDHVLIPSPSYPLFQFLLELHDINFDAYPLCYDGASWRIDRERFAKLVNARTKAVILVNPNNPTCSYITADDRKFLNEQCARHQMAIIADEVFLDYPLSHLPKPGSFLSNDHVLTFVLSGVSKILGMPQMKLAWIAVNGPQACVQQALERLDIIADTYLSVNTPVQLALPSWLNEKEIIQRQIISRVKANLAFLQTKGLKLLNVEAGWYAVIEVAGIKDEEVFVLELLTTQGVLVHPGFFFDFPSEGLLVLSLLPPEDVFQEALERIVKKIKLL